MGYNQSVDAPDERSLVARPRHVSAVALRTALRRTVPAGVHPTGYAVAVGAAIAQVLTILWTWNLWTERDRPPNLPVVSILSHVNWAPPLILLALLTIASPRRVAPLFCGAYALAVLGDQVRLQPEVVSLALLMTAPLFGAQGRRVARWHLTTLWTWAGIHKVLSLGWSDDGAAFIASALGHPSSRALVAVGLPVAEIAIGVASAFRKLWPFVRWAGVALNLGIFITLSPLFADWNSSVWSWNVALAMAAALLFFNEEDRVRPNRIAVVIVAVLVVYPALFYVGVADAYLAHNLYSGNTSSAASCDASGSCSTDLFDTWSALNVPLPPDERIYRALFDRVCAPGSTLIVRGPATRLTDPPTVHHHACPVGRR